MFLPRIHPVGRRVRPSVRRDRCFAEALEDRRLFAFGVTSTTGSTASFVVDNGGDLKFSVLRPGATLASTIHIGDVTSIKYKNQEMLAAYSVTSRYSHYEQGLGSTATVTYAVDNAAGWILVKVDDSAAASGAVIQYYGVRRNDNNLYFASLPIDVNNGPGEGRFIAYLNRSVFSNPEEPSDNAPRSAADTVRAIEGQDVFGHSDGTTSSKFFNMGRRMIENDVHGVTGMAAGQPVGAWMFMGNRERSAGGPFFKDIDFQSSNAVEIYNCIFTGHTQTEAYRQGLHTYAMQFNDGSAPTTPDYSWLESARDAGGNPITGLIGAAGRGAISGKASGNPAGSETVVTLSNSSAQYWDMADANGDYAIAGVLPGTYTETLYRDELAVGTRTVTIAAGQTARADIANTYYTPTPIWRIGTWDGTPREFLNADKIETIHPSDVRMAPWTNVNYVVGTSTDAQWPLVQFKAPNAANNPNNLLPLNPTNRITFNLTSAQAATAMTLRIGITLAFANGRPIISVNGGSYSTAPAPSSQPDSRGITRGTWRGNNFTHAHNIATSALRAGTNTIDIGIASGSYDIYSSYLQPSVTFDAIDLVPTASLTNAPRLASIALSPANSSINPGGTMTFVATARDQFNNPIAANVRFSAARGVIDDTGAYIAPTTAGPDTITATVGTVSATTSITVDTIAPTGVGSFLFETAQAIRLTFSEDVIPSIDTEDLIVTNAATGERVPASEFTLTTSAGTPTTATWTHSGILPDGDYRATLPAVAATDAAGNPLAGDVVVDFFVMQADANRDRRVGFEDLVLLAQNYGQPGKTFGQGDFNYDGNVGFDDLVLLAQRYNTAASNLAAVTTRPSPAIKGSPTSKRPAEHLLG